MDYIESTINKYEIEPYDDDERPKKSDDYYNFD